MYIEQLVSQNTDKFLIKYTRALSKIDDFSFFQTTLKAIKFYYGFMSKEDYLHYKLFYDD